MQRSTFIAIIVILICSFLGFFWYPVFADSSPEDTPLTPCPNYEKYFGDKAKYLCKPYTESNMHQSVELNVQNGGPDNFGYVWDDSGVIDWIEINPALTTTLTYTGTQIFTDTNGVDDKVITTTIGFPFEFYENIYLDDDLLYISSNGILGFDSSIETENASMKNYPIPMDTNPQNFIALFWDDLAIGGSYNNGSVFYYSGEENGDGFLVVEYYKVTRNTASDTLTFEIILYESGEIVMQYLDLTGYLESATVGIEDMDGVDGLQYLYNSAGLSSGKRIVFSRPSDAPGVKVFPIYQSAATIKDKTSFKVKIRNTGGNGADVYDLTLNSNPSTWLGEVYDESGSRKLTDTDGDSVIDTGSLGEGETVIVTVKVDAPSDALVGDKGVLTFTAQSSKNIHKSMSVNLHSFIPAPFALAYSESTFGMNLELIWRGERQRTQVYYMYTGSSFGVNRMKDKGYLYFWEKNYGNNDYTDLEYVVLNQFGFITKSPTKLTDNGKNVYDTTPVFEAAPNGKVGVSWVRHETKLVDFVEKHRYNVFFAILDNEGNIEYGPINVSNNSEFTGGNDGDKLVFRDSRLVATDDNRFSITWIEKHSFSSGKVTTDVKYAVINSLGSVVKSPFYVEEQNPDDGIDYDEPILASMAGSKTLLVYYSYDSGIGINKIYYSQFDSNGYKLSGPIELTTGGGGRMDAAQLGSGKVVLAWGEPVSGNIRYYVFNSNLTKAVDITELANPDQREAGSVSVTKDENNQAVLTWMDSEWNQRLYYALVDGNGTVTSPEIVKYVAQSDFVVFSSSFGEGNATLSKFYHINLPFIER